MTPNERLVQIRSVVRVMGCPYGSELTYKHPYHWDMDYQSSWNNWRDSGFGGDEPLPKEKNEFVHSSLDDGFHGSTESVCPTCLSSIATWSWAYEKIKGGEKK